MKSLKKNCILLLILSLTINGCAYGNKTKLIEKEISANSLSQANRLEVQKKIGIKLYDFYCYTLEGNVFSGAYYNKQVFLFKNGLLTNIVEYAQVERIWAEEFTIKDNNLPYAENLFAVHHRLSELPLFVDSRQQAPRTTAQDISDGVTAGLILVFSIPIIPIILLGTINTPGKESSIIETDWENEVVGKTSGAVHAKIGTPQSYRSFTDGDMILGYKQKYFWIPHFVGIHKGKDFIKVLN